jgi:cyanate permease
MITPTPLHRSKTVYFLTIYISVYSVAAIWLLLDGWLTNFSSVLNLSNNESHSVLENEITFIVFTCIGALLGSALLNIVSFHRYVAIEKNFDKDHMFGFIFSPLLAIIVGILTYCIIHSGIFILSGNQTADSDSISASLGHVAIGSVAGYNWDVFVKKVQSLSAQLFKSDSE